MPEKSLTEHLPPHQGRTEALHTLPQHQGVLHLTHQSRMQLGGNSYIILRVSSRYPLKGGPHEALQSQQQEDCSWHTHATP